MKRKVKSKLPLPWPIEKMTWEFTRDPKSFTQELVRGLVKVKGEKKEGTFYFGAVLEDYALDKDPVKALSSVLDVIIRRAKKGTNEHKAKR